MRDDCRENLEEILVWSTSTQRYRPIGDTGCATYNATHSSHQLRYKNEIRIGSNQCNRFPQPHTWHSRKGRPFLLGLCSYHLRKSCAGADMVCSREKLVFILEYYLASKLFAAVQEAFSSQCPDSEVQNKRIHQLATRFRGAGSVHLW